MFVLLCTCVASQHCWFYFQYVAASVGLAKGDMEKLKGIIEAVPDLSFICVDVANGYSEHFVEFVKQVRKTCPTHTIMVTMKCLISL